MSKKLRIGVLMGGLSIEREVSFTSGRTVCDHLDTTLYDIVPLFQTARNRIFILPWRFLHRGKISDFEDRLPLEAQEVKWDNLKDTIDFVFIAQHGRYAENGSLQGLLELLNIPYLGSKVLGSAVGMDKLLQKKLLKAAHISVPESITIEPHTLHTQTVESLKKQLATIKLSLPLVVKPAQEGSSLGITIVFKEEELVEAVLKAATVTPGLTQPVLLEERIEGMEFTCVILINPRTQEPFFLPPTEILYEPGVHLHGYEQKYMPGRSLKFTPARCTPAQTQAIQTVCLEVARTLDFKTIARIDGFLKNDGSITIIDPNTLSGLAPSGFFFTQAAQIDMSHSDIINHLIKLELEGYGMGTDIFALKNQLQQEEQKKIRVGVLLGGPSYEKETSLDSGRNVCYKLSPHKYSVIPLFVDANKQLYPLSQKLLVLNATAEIEHKLDRSTRINWHDLPSLIDFAFIALHGAPGENGEVQGMLEMLQIPYNGSGIATSALCLDKYKTARFLESQGFDTPQSQLLTRAQWESEPQETTLAALLATFCLPLIVKPHDDGCSVMVQKVTNESQLLPAIKNIFATSKDVALIEEWISGMELTVGVIGNNSAQALVPSQAVSAGDILSIQEKFLPGAGENKTPAPLPAETLALVQTTMEQVYQAVGCSGYARIDCFYQNAQQSPTGKERVITLEINTLPGITPATCIFHQAAERGIKPMDFIDLIVTLGFEKHARQTTQQPTKTSSDIFISTPETEVTQ